MWGKMFEQEVQELKELGVHTTKVKCGEFYSIPQIIRLYKLVKPLLEKEKENEIEEGQQQQN